MAGSSIIYESNKFIVGNNTKKDWIVGDIGTTTFKVNNSQVAYNSSSRTLKKNIKSFKKYDKALDDILKTPLFTFEFKNNHPEKNRMGIISEELPKNLQIKEDPILPDLPSIRGTLWAGIKALHKKLMDFKANINSQITELTNKIDSKLESLQKGFDAQLEKLKSLFFKEIENLNNKFTALTEDFKSQTKSLSNKINSQITNLAEKINSQIEGLKIEVVKKFSFLEQQIESLKKEHIDTKNKFQTELKLSNKKLTENQIELVKTKKELAITQNAFQTKLTDTKKELREAKNKLQTELKLSNKRLTQNQTELSDTKKELTEAKNNFKKSNKKLMENTIELSNTKKELASTKRKLAEIESELNRIKEKIK